MLTALVPYPINFNVWMEDLLMQAMKMKSSLISISICKENVTAEQATWWVA
jgi:hypothetical protein